MLQLFRGRVTVPTKIFLLALCATSVSLVAAGYYIYTNQLSETETRFKDKLGAIAATAGLNFPAADHRRFVKTGADKHFAKIKQYMSRVSNANGISKELIYTFTFKEFSQSNPILHFSTMLHPKPFVGSPYTVPDGNVALYQRLLKDKVAVTTSMYGDDHGSWISGLAPIIEKGKVVAILQVDHALDDVIAKHRMAIIEAEVFLLLVGLFVSLLSLIFGRRITRSLLKLTAAVSQVATGDLNSRLQIKSKDEFGTLAVSFNEMIDSLEQARTKLTASNKKSGEISNSLSRQSAALAGYADDIASEADRQKMTSVQVQNDFDAILRQIETSQKANQEFIGHTQILLEQVEATQSGNEQVAASTVDVAERTQDLLELLQQGRTSVESISRVVQEVFERTARMNDILDVIESITNKLNMLSLNASIESAKAGESGRGFSIIAQEMGRLSTVSSEQLTAIRELVGETGATLTANKETITGGAQTLQGSMNLSNEIVDSLFELTGMLSEGIERFEKIQAKIHETAAGSESMAQGQAEQFQKVQALHTSFKSMASMPGHMLKVAKEFSSAASDNKDKIRELAEILGSKN